MKSPFRAIISRLGTPISSGFFLTKRIPKHAGVVLECHDADRTLNVEGVAYAQILDSFQEELQQSGFKCVTLAKPGSVLVGTQAYGEVISPVSLLEEIFILTLKLLEKLSIPLGLTEFQVRLYEKVLVDTSCEIVVGIQPSLPLVVASRNLNLPVADLLHGYGINRNHKYYGAEAIADASRCQLCTDYIALDKYSKSVIEDGFSVCGKKARVWSLFSPVLGNITSKKEALVIHREEKYRKLFLISLQWGIERVERKHPHCDGELHPTIAELITQKEMLDYGFIIKPHPIILRDKRVMSLLSANYGALKNVRINHKSTLQSILQVVDAHLTISSSTVREAAIMGVSSLVFSSDDGYFEGDDYLFQPEIEAGMAIRVHNWSIEKIISWLKAMDKKEKLPPGYKESILPEYESAALLVSDILSCSTRKI